MPHLERPSLKECLYKCSCIRDCFFVKVSSIIFIVIPLRIGLHFTSALFVTLFAGQKMDKILIVTVQTTVNLKSVSSHCTAKYSSVSYIVANFTSLLTIFWGTYFYLQWLKLNLNEIAAKLWNTLKWGHWSCWENFPNFLIHIKEVDIVSNNLT